MSEIMSKIDNLIQKSTTSVSAKREATDVVKEESDEQQKPD